MDTSRSGSRSRSRSRLAIRSSSSRRRRRWYSINCLLYFCFGIFVFRLRLSCGQENLLSYLLVLVDS